MWISSCNIDEPTHRKCCASDRLDMDLRERELERRAAELDRRAAVLDSRAAGIDKRDEESKQRAEDLDVREKDLGIKTGGLEGRVSIIGCFHMNWGLLTALTCEVVC